MKYEAVFGNQELFDGAGTFTGLDVVVHSIASGIKSYARLSDLTPESLRNHPVCAMRRIIAEPKRWTVEDRKAGKLPPIGSKYLAGSDKREFTCLVHGKGNGTVSVIGFNSDDEVTGYQVQYCYPIESPEEKAARLREEWCIKALSSCSILSGMQKYELKRLGGYIEDIYDALLSGELPVPVKE